MENINYTTSFLKRYWDKIHKRGEDDCWNWIAGLNTGGYGAIKGTRTDRDGFPFYPMWQAHIVSFTIHNGPPNEGLFVLHKCNNRRCVNPKHLYEGTQLDNGRDMAVSGILKGSNNPTSKFTDEQVRTIRVQHSNGLSFAELGDIYDCTRQCIWLIVKRKHYPNVV